ncbi:hypothetical protein P3S67_016152 [Capsicum chacoense]
MQTFDRDFIVLKDLCDCGRVWLSCMLHLFWNEYYHFSAPWEARRCQGSHVKSKLFLGVFRLTTEVVILMFYELRVYILGICTGER